MRETLPRRGAAGRRPPSDTLGRMTRPDAPGAPGGPDARGGRGSLLTPPPAVAAPRIARVALDHLHRLLQEISPTHDAADLGQVAEATLSGGKRVRGWLALVGADLAGRDTSVPLPDWAWDIAAALELYQASALAHDDLIDHADTRRGHPTPHVALARVHRERGWSGSADDFGAAGAVLVGDLLLSAADHALAVSCAPLPPRRGAQVMSRFTLMHAEVALGQYLDVRAEQVPLSPDGVGAPGASGASGVRDAVEVVRHKSARYSVVHPVVVGCLAAGGDARTVADAERVLEPWGVAFQLRDDDLGVFGDPGLTGKPTGDDLREGKHTALLALAWAQADPSERRLLASGLGDADAPERLVADMTDVIARRGRAAHEALIREQVEAGRSALASCGLDAPRRAMLEGLGEFLTRRSA